jgi:heme-degrading monooxygenase HmoA
MAAFDPGELRLAREEALEAVLVATGHSMLGHEPRSGRRRSSPSCSVGAAPPGAERPSIPTSSDTGHGPCSHHLDEGVQMIARIWRGAVKQEDADAYADYMQDTGVAGYAKVPGNRGVWMLRRERDGLCEFVMFTLWDSLDSVKAFAGEEYEAAVFYPED